MARVDGRHHQHSPKREIADRIQRWLPFECPSLMRLTNRELRCLERYLCEASGREPDCHMIGGYSDGQG